MHSAADGSIELAFDGIEWPPLGFQAPDLQQHRVRNPRLGPFNRFPLGARMGNDRKMKAILTRGVTMIISRWAM